MERARIFSFPNLGKKALSLIIFLPLSLLLATVVTDKGNYMFLGTMAGIIFFIILTRFEIALFLILITSYFLSYTIWFFDLSSPLINLAYVLIVMVLLREYFFTGDILPVRTPINYILITIIALALLSIANSDSSVYAAFKGLLRHISFPLLFILIVTAQPDEKLLRKMITAIIIISFLQVIASLMQYTWYSTIAPKPYGMRADMSGGLLGPSCGGYTAVLMSMIVCLLIAIIIVRGYRWYLLLGAILLFVPIVLASARAGVLLFSAAVGFMLVFAPLPQHGSLFQRLFIAVILIAGLLAVVLSGLAGEEFKNIFNPQYAYDYSIRQADSGMGRLQAFEIIKIYLRDPVSLTVGLGPGMLTPVSITENPSSLIASNPTLFRSVTGYAYTVLELGYSGMVLFLLLFAQIYRVGRKFLKQIDDPYWEAVAMGFSGMAFIFVISTFYTNSWIYYPLPFTFWAFAAAIYRVGILKGYFYK